VSDKTTVEVGGVKFTGGKLFLVITVISSICGAAWGGFEFYNDYRNMKAKIERYVAPDLSGIRSELAIIDQKLDDNNEYSKDIKNGLRDDIVRLERIVDQVEDDINGIEEDVRQEISLAEERFENKRDALQNDYDQAKERLRIDTERKLKDLEARLNKRLQRALDNPLAQ